MMRATLSSNASKTGSAPFHVLVSKPFRHQHDMRKLILQGLTSNDKNDVIRNLATKNGLEKLDKILSSAFSLNAGSYSQNVSFQRVAVPLCHLLSNEEVRHGVLLTQLQEIYGTVQKQALFFSRYMNCVSSVLGSGVIKDSQDDYRDPNEYRPKSVYDMVTPFANMCLAIIATLHDSRARPIWKTFVPDLYDAVTDYINHTADVGEDARKCLNALDRLKKAIKIKERTSQLCRSKGNSEAAIEADISAFVAKGPGALYKEGPRHSNDKTDIRDIQIVPTHDEVASLVSPYLPYQSGLLAQASSKWIIDHVERHLDLQFRLLREDLIAPIRDAVQHFFQAKVFNGLKKGELQFSFHETGNSQGSCYIFNNAVIENRSAHPFLGSGYQLRFDRITLAKRKTLKSFSDLLQPYSWVCLILGCVIDGRKKKDSFAQGRNRGQLSAEKASDDAIDTHGAQVVFGIVHPHGRDTSQKDGCDTVCISPVSIEDHTQLMDRLGQRDGDGKGETGNFMLQVSGHCSVGAEVLKSLQSLHSTEIYDVGWLRRILKPEYSIESSHTCGQQDMDMHLPRYVSSETRYDFSFLALPEERSAVGHLLREFNINDVESMERTLIGLQGKIRLDESQITAFIHGITSDVALIQGPPGCGKTYIGVKIVQALLKNSSGNRNMSWKKESVGYTTDQTENATRPALDPILCISHTNHALDQFLEALIASGVVSKDIIIRMGSRSKSEILQDRGLNQVAHQVSTGHERYEFFKQGEVLANIQKEIVELTTNLKTTYIGTKGFERWLTKNRRGLLQQISGFGPGESLQNQDQDLPQIKGVTRALDLWISSSENPNERERRQALASAARSEFCEVTQNRVQKLHANLKIEMQKYEEIRDTSKYRALRGARIVGCTTSGAAQHFHLLRALGPPVVICEEAAEVLEAHILTSISPRTEHLILIGDHLQLRPKVNEYRLSVESGQKHDLDISLFERLVRDKRVHYTTLCTQRRMHPKISQIARLTLYPSLRDSDAVMAYPQRPKGFQTPVFFLDHNHEEADSSQHSSRRNHFEASFICALVEYLVRQGYKQEQIAVLTPYLGQLLLVREELRKKSILVYVDEKDLEEIKKGGREIDDDQDVADCQDQNPKKEEEEMQGTESANLGSCVRVSTVDGFQGEEADIVLISAVRCNSYESVGFLGIDNRVNVMLTRAKYGMFILGSARTIRASKTADYFKTALTYLSDNSLIGHGIPLYCENHKVVTVASCEDDIPQDGGCDMPCVTRKACGHVCTRRCHPDDADHQLNDCLESCARLIKDCRHPCKRLCREKCGGCQAQITIELPCGHSSDSICDKKELAFQKKCTHVVQQNFLLPCSHERDLICWEELKGAAPCLERCGLFRSCGHICQQTCSNCSPSGKTGTNSEDHFGECEEACQRKLICGHTCGQKPCHKAKECPPCSKKCRVTCEHSSCDRKCKEVCYCCAKPCTWQCLCEDKETSKCQLLCGTPCLRLPCDARCAKNLECGHRCPSLCGEECPSKRFCVECARNNEPWTESTGEQTVEYFTMKSLRELEEDAEGHLPILVLACGHAFTMETLDGYMEFDSFYERGSDGRWTSPVCIAELNERGLGPFSTNQRETPPCLICRSPISGLKRYKRASNLFQLHALHRKWMNDTSREAATMERIIEDLRTQMDDLALVVKKKGDGKEAAIAFRRNIRKIYWRVKRLCRETANNCPTAVLYEKETAARKKRRPDNEPHPDSDLLRPDNLPFILTLSVRLNINFLRCRAACYISSSFWRSLPVGKKTGEYHREKTGLAFQLKEVDELFKTALGNYTELIQLCQRGSYKNKEKEVKALFIANLYNVIEDFREIGVSEDLETRSAKDLRKVCVEHLQGLVGIVPQLTQGDIDALRRKEQGDFYQVVTSTERKIVFHAMANDVGASAGHWYRCPNGHTYTIGECGQAMQRSKCPECGAVIGGISHSLQEGNSLDPNFQRIGI